MAGIPLPEHMTLSGLLPPVHMRLLPAGLFTLVCSLSGLTFAVSNIDVEGYLGLRKSEVANERITNSDSWLLTLSGVQKILCSSVRLLVNLHRILLKDDRRRDDVDLHLWPVDIDDVVRGQLADEVVGELSLLHLNLHEVIYLHELLHQLLDAPDALLLLGCDPVLLILHCFRLPPLVSDLQQVIAGPPLLWHKLAIVLRLRGLRKIYRVLTTDERRVQEGVGGLLVHHDLRVLLGGESLVALLDALIDPGSEGIPLHAVDQVGHELLL